MGTSSSVSSPQQLESPTCKCGLSAKLSTSMTIENGGRRFYKCPSRGSNSCGYKIWLDEKLPPHVSSMIHDNKIELDSIRKERDHLKKIVDGNGISDLKDMTATNESSNLQKEEKVSNLKSEDGNTSANLKKEDNDKVSKLESQVYQLINFLVVSWALILGFVAAKML